MEKVALWGVTQEKDSLLSQVNNHEPMSTALWWITFILFSRWDWRQIKIPSLKPSPVGEETRDSGENPFLGVSYGLQRVKRLK